MGDILTVQKQEAALARAEAVVGILIDWADWQKGYRVKVGFAPKSAGFQSGGVVGDSTSDDAYASADNARFEVVDACVDDLAPNQSAAIYHRYCASVFRMRNYEGSLFDAHEILSRVFRCKGIMW